jgi:hypothetical protein
MLALFERSIVYLWLLIFNDLTKKFSSIYGTKMLITLVNTRLLETLSWASLVLISHHPHTCYQKQS